MNNAATHSSTAATTAVPPTAPAVERAGAMPTPAAQAAAAKDRTLTSPAVLAAARSALECLTEPDAVGEHVAASLDAERTVTHLFDCTLAGYRGWRWAVTVARPPRGRSATICEMELLPGEDALLAPAWIPWADRLQPGDVSRSDRLPRRETDERLEPGWEATGDEEGDTVALDELDLGRARVLSAEGVSRAAQRWYDGDHGPDAEGVRKAHATCSTCGFFIRMAGPLRRVFGICANEWAADDGRVVSLDHGCGAHSETDLPDQGPEWPVVPSRLDEEAMEPLGTDGASIRGDADAGRPAPRQEADPDAPARSTGSREPDEPAEAARAADGAGQLRPRPGDPGDPDEADDQAPDPATGPAEAAEPRTDGAAAPAPGAQPAVEEPDAPTASAQDAGEQTPEPSAGDAAQDTGSSAAGSETDPSASGSAEDRAAAARDAVADLAAELGEHQPARPATERVTSEGITLAELEAHLPDHR